MIRFVHTSDIHFGMENYGKIDAHSGIHSRLLDFVKALDFCVEYTLNHDIDFFLFCGDAYKTIHPSPTQQQLLMRCFLRLQKAGIPLVIIVGNHDNPLSFGKANTLDIFGDLPLEGFHVIAKPTSFHLKTKNGPVQIVGIPWPTRNNIALSDHYTYQSAVDLTDYIAQSISSLIKNFAHTLDHTLPAILAGHMTVSSGVFSGSEKRAIYGNDPILMPSQLTLVPFDYVALGHLHRHQDLNPQHYPPLVYSGSIERIDFGERNEEKGFCVVTLEKKGTTQYEFIKTPTRPFIQIEATIVGPDNHTEQILTTLRQHTLKDAIVKLMYHVPSNVKDSVDLQKIVNACNSAQYLVSITPIRTIESREKRTNMKVSMDIETALATYFSSKAECKEKQEELIKKALELHAEVLEHQHEDDCKDA